MATTIRPRKPLAWRVGRMVLNGLREFSREQARQIRRDLGATGGEVTCPHCESMLRPVVDLDDGCVRWLLRCGTCNRGLVLQEAATPDRLRTR